MRRLVLVNPNTDRGATDAMAAIAADAAGCDAVVVGVTAASRVALITDEATLRVAAAGVVEMVPGILDLRPDAVIVSSFGDPALHELRDRLTVPVTGICEAAMAEAGRDGRRFGVVTTTPDLAPAIVRAAAAYGHGAAFAGTWPTSGDPLAVMRNPEDLCEILAAACHRALAEARLDALVIGGGPLASAARTLASRMPVPLIEPVAAAVRLAIRRLASDEPRGLSSR